VSPSRDPSRIAATDIATFAECGHAATLTRETKEGLLPRPPRRLGFDHLLVVRGEKHELACVELLGRTRAVTPIPAGADALANTLEAMRAGADIIYQGEIAQARLFGRPDFLLRVPMPSAFGPWSYEVLDAKLSRQPKPRALLQLAFYAEILTRMQGVAPRSVHLLLGDMRWQSFPRAQIDAYFRRIFARFLTALEASAPTYPEPVELCDVCDWFPRCDERRRADDHLTFVAGITRRQRRALAGIGVATLAHLAALPRNQHSPVSEIAHGPFTRIREQARIQGEGQTQQKMLYELLPAAGDGRGLELLPEPSPGDVFLDLEGDSYVLPGGLEYLVGIALPGANGSATEYRALWGLERATEKVAFERTIALLMDRRAADPGMHIYHYGHYEPTALKRLAGRHSTCVHELDALLRGRVFVDLYAVVRRSLRASVESYSIKHLEPLYGFARTVALRDANACLVAFETWMELHGQETLAADLRAEIEGYNRDDCISTLRLREWLEERRDELAMQVGRPPARPAAVASEPSDALAEELGRVAVVKSALLAGVAEDPTVRSEEAQARWLLAHMLEWHRREDKSAHWEYFRLCDLSDEELTEERTPLGGLTYAGVVAQEKQSSVHRYRFPPQDHALDRALEIHDPRTKTRAGTLVAIDDAARHIDVKRKAAWDGPHPTALIPREIVTTTELRESLLRLGGRVAAELPEEGVHAAAPALLRQRSPWRLASAADSTERGIATILSLEEGVLPIQGPPGTGKTFLAARMIAALLDAGKRVGVTAHSHRVITNLVDAACRAAAKDDVRLAGVQKAPDGERSSHAFIGPADTDAIAHALRSGAANLAAGTAWLWAHPAMAGAVDVLFVDEAGQMSLANALAAAPAARTLVLLGDPQQLDQPSKGIHPPGMPTSALAHLLRGEATLRAESGLFLDETWRMHEDVCAFVSEQFYEARLRPRPELARLRLVGPPRVEGTGLRFVPVVHRGNRSESAEEAEAVSRLVDALLGGDSAWTCLRGVTRPLTAEDVLIVAPYNAHVARLKKRLPGLRVGTVDKFQGQEAPVVVYSMATSLPEEAPHGAEFLYGKNRFNVAISRARCAAFLVASPALLELPCKTARQVELVNAFCRYVEVAREVMV
jgi:predicted RecB family nuclease